MAEEHTEEYWNQSQKAFSFDEIASSSIHDTKLLPDDNTSERSYEIQRNDLLLSDIISDLDLQKVLEEQSMEEIPVPKGITPEEELKILRRQAQDRKYPPPVATTITNIIMKKPYMLENYKSLEVKEHLIDEAINSGCGDAILSIVLFLLKTVNQEIFIRLLSTREMAINHYVNYLNSRCRVHELSNFLSLLGKSSNLAMLQYNICMKTCKVDKSKIEKLNTVCNDYFKQPGIDHFYVQLVRNYINLLDWQAKESANTEMALDLFDSPVLQTVYFACNMHKWATDSDVPSRYNPFKMAEQHNVNQSQFEWVALNERARSHAWPDLEILFEKKSWHNLKLKNFSINIPLDMTVQQLHGLQAPSAVLKYFLSKMSDPKKRLEISQKIGATNSIVDSLVVLKNKDELEKFLGTLEPKTESWFYAEKALKNMKSKWKTENLNLLKS